MKEAYEDMSKDELVHQCIVYESIIQKIESKNEVLTKEDIMVTYKCGSDKALRILKMIFQVGLGNKIGKEYYVSVEAHQKFLEIYAGKDLAI